MNSMYKVGDPVVITNNDATYSRYASWFSAHEDTVKFISYFKVGFVPNDCATGRIVAIHPHENLSIHKFPLCAIMLDDFDYVVLLSETGIELNREVLFSDLIIQ